MKTTNIVLIGVVGVGAVGAYMYMKNKQAQNALLSGSLPAPVTNQGGATPPLATTPFIPTSNLIFAPTPPIPNTTTPFIPTPILTEKVEINKDLNLDAYNLQQTLDEIKNLDNNNKVNPYPARIKQNIFYGGTPNPAWESWNYMQRYQYPKQRAILVEKLAKLGYKYDKGLLIKI